MGLRIVDRGLKRSIDVTDQEKLAAFVHEAEHWLHTKGTAATDNDKDQLISQYQNTTKTITEHNLVEKANAIKENMNNHKKTVFPHTHFDVATLLALL